MAIDLAERSTPATPVEPAVTVRWAAPDRSHLRFVHLSFEGPDRYSSAGGLAVRVTTLAHALARAGATVDLYFVGDPSLPGLEARDGVTLHRWCQAISTGAPGGVYDQEERKIEDLCIWWPAHLADVVADDHAAGRRTVVLAEDWHTAWPLVALHDELVRRGLRHAATLVWTANNRFGFERLDFARLASAATIVTISRAMKHLMWRYGVNPLVVPNGIPDSSFDAPDSAEVASVRAALPGALLLAKVGRWDPDKRWMMAIDAVGRLRDRGERAVLLARGWNGNPEASAHYCDLRAHAAALGLAWHVVAERPEAAGHGLWHLGEPIADAGIDAHLPTGGVLELAFPIVGAQLRALYGASDLVLANSGFEPFGLVGIEAMAARAVVVTGATGEDYVIPFHNGFALDSDDAEEIVRDLDWLRQRPARADALRVAAYETALRYRWSDVVDRLVLSLSLDDVA
jgi:glycosyltransferase involved in cell wall biosynthesis